MMMLCQPAAARLAALLTGFWLLIWPKAVLAHAAGQSFVALLPTGPYRLVGVLIVALSIGWLALRPGWSGLPLPRSRAPRRWPGLPPAWRLASGWLAAAGLVWLLNAGYFGSRDPLENGLVLAFWVCFWMAAVMGQGLVGNIWGWLSPFQGLGKSMLVFGRWQGRWSLPGWVGVWPAVGLLLAFSAFTLADPAPDDPARLAFVLICYLLFSLAGMALFGVRSWLGRVEFLSLLMRQFARLAPLRGTGRGWQLGWPGWQLCRDEPGIGQPARAGLPVFIILLLGTGSFDGLNETFAWLDFIGVNPLAFPGRSAVIAPVLSGLLAANLLLLVLFSLLLIAGDRLAGARHSLRHLLFVFAPSLLPIALGYHIAHYLPSLLVDGQYALLAINDPLDRGWNWLGLAGHHVTSGFFNNRETMRVIWLVQAAGIVFGHVLAVIVADHRAIALYQRRRAVITAQLPLAVFMILYTWLGLWLLAAPKGG